MAWRRPSPRGRRPVPDGGRPAPDHHRAPKPRLLAGADLRDDAERRPRPRRRLQRQRRRLVAEHPNTNRALYSSGQYEGSGYLAANASGPGGSVYRDIAYPVAAGQPFCASAEVDAVGSPSAPGELVLWLLGGSSGQDSSSVHFTAGSTWAPVTTCVTATTTRNDVRVQFYPGVNAGTIGIDAVDVH